MYLGLQVKSFGAKVSDLVKAEQKRHKVQVEAKARTFLSRLKDALSEQILFLFFSILTLQLNYTKLKVVINFLYLCLKKYFTNFEID